MLHYQVELFLNLAKRKHAQSDSLVYLFADDNLNFLPLKVALVIEIYHATGFISGELIDHNYAPICKRLFDSDISISQLMNEIKRMINEFC